jgi:hypothetical protein
MYSYMYKYEQRRNVYFWLKKKKKSVKWTLQLNCEAFLGPGISLYSQKFDSVYGEDWGKQIKQSVLAWELKPDNVMC